MTRIKSMALTVVDSEHSVRWTERAWDNHLTTTILTVSDTDGVVGIGGWDSYTPGEPDRSVAETIRSLAPAILGRDVTCRESLADELRIGVIFPHSPEALSVMNIALWDLAAKRAETPLYKMLGGARERIPAYASTETMPDIEDYLAMVARARADGLRAVKVHAWGEPERDIELLQSIREADPDLVLMHDAEGVYDRHGALRVGRALEQIGARWYEAPLPDWDIEGYRELRSKLDVPVLAAGYTVSDVHQIAAALCDPPFSAIRADIGISGGLSNLCRLAELAAAHSMDLEPVSYGHSLRQLANLHVMLAYPNISFLELAYPLEPYEYGVTSPLLRPDCDGMVCATDGPGLGIELDWTWIDQHAALRMRLPE